jgi:hypothetical protein
VTACLQEYADKKQERIMKSAQKSLQKALDVDPEYKPT